ncbi:MAG: endolytic transglycosylase MltG [Paracoccaceae bacterium]
MWRSIASNALTLFVLLLLAAAAVVAWGRQEFAGPGPLADAVCFKVERGASLSNVADNLAAQGVVSSASIFRIGTDYAGRSDDLRFGSYLIEAGSSMGEVLDDLTAGGQSTCGREVNFRIGVARADILLRELDPASGDFVEVVRFEPGVEAEPAEFTDARDDSDLRWRVTVAEGVTSWQVIDALKKADFLAGEVPDLPAEGTIAPNSYEVEPGADRAALVAQMVALQTEVLAEEWARRAEGLPYETPEEALIMASIVEKETGIAEERGRVASVFVNRLRDGMKLQTDPTVIYGVTEGEGVLGRGLRQSELRRETPWNTYVIDGLPPTPIANPGRAAIAAALNPDTTPYLFFVADGTGGHAFAETLAEHNENVARWREIEAQAGEDGATGVQGE